MMMKDRHWAIKYHCSSNVEAGVRSDREGVVVV
jgi:hypothetical protein